MSAMQGARHITGNASSSANWRSVLEALLCSLRHVRSSNLNQLPQQTSIPIHWRRLHSKPAEVAQPRLRAKCQCWILHWHAAAASALSALADLSVASYPSTLLSNNYIGPDMTYSVCILHTGAGRQQLGVTQLGCNYYTVDSAQRVTAQITPPISSIALKGTLLHNDPHFCFRCCCRGS